MMYVKPTTCVVKLNNQTCFLAGSDSGNTGGSGSGNPGGNSRELRSVWKDDEE